MDLLLGNDQIAKRLNEIRTLMELGGEPFFKFMAYERAASAVENAGPLKEMLATGELVKLPGIGKSIAATIAELCERGDCELLRDLYVRFPATIFEVLGISGIGIKTAGMLFERYGIGSLCDLEAAVESGALEEIPRMGKKSIENIKRGILAYKGRQNRTALGAALRVARGVLEYLHAGPPTDRLTYAGSLRRAEVTVGDIDIVCTSNAAAAVIDYFVKWERAQSILAEGPTKASIWLQDGLQIDLRVLPDAVYGNLLQHFTGSREHNIQLREYAVRKGLRVSENGILELETGRSITCRTEEEVYAALDMQYVPPELRSGIGEIEAARARELPELVRLADIRGDFHMHSTWSDGRDSLETMIAQAARRGYEYHAISEHSWGRGPKFGLAPTQIREQREYIREVGKQHAIRTLCSSEVDILADGSMDYDDAVLAQFDIVIGSIHSALNQSRDELTRRLIRACENPYVNIIGHPTGRYGSFGGYEFDYDSVFAAAARTGTALEIDGQEGRLDLPAPLARRASEFGVTFTTDSDAHSMAQLANIDLAVSQARRAGLRKEQVLNTYAYEDVKAFVEKKRVRA
ncbi:MAG: DNA polymerase/3'-5' exonuclease PolX [Candidatus Eremiobacteraeota bacterium]|nr:DNA polymerase/3'-5' exonuclease PolX [Candidatus Eremiobacteraeota bacterium]